jgi:hypothetical protein
MSSSARPRLGRRVLGCKTLGSSWTRRRRERDNWLAVLLDCRMVQTPRIDVGWTAEP